MHKMTTLSQRDEETYLSFLKLGILRPLEEGLSKRPKLMIPVFCSDGAHFSHKVSAFLRGADIGRDSTDTLFHATLLNGGVLNLSVLFPTIKTFQLWLNGLIVLKNIDQALAMKGNTFHQLPLIGHHPCGVAATLGLSLDQNVEWVIRAQIRLLKRYPKEAHGASVKCYMHICRTNDAGEIERTMFFIDRTAWDAYLRSPKNEQRLIHFLAFRLLTILIYRQQRRMKLAMQNMEKSIITFCKKWTNPKL